MRVATAGSLPGRGTQRAEEDEPSFLLRGGHSLNAYCHGSLLSHRMSRDHQERGFYKLRPANKTDHLCQSWQYCHMFMKFRQFIT